MMVKAQCYMCNKPRPSHKKFCGCWLYLVARLAHYQGGICKNGESTEQSKAAEVWMFPKN
jgi:hypothetical protein